MLQLKRVPHDTTLTNATFSTALIIAFFFFPFILFYINSFHFPSPPLFSGDPRRNLTRKSRRKTIFPILQIHFPHHCCSKYHKAQNTLLNSFFSSSYVLIFIHYSNAIENLWILDPFEWISIQIHNFASGYYSIFTIQAHGCNLHDLECNLVFVVLLVIVMWKSQC